MPTVLRGHVIDEDMPTPSRGHGTRGNHEPSSRIASVGSRRCAAHASAKRPPWRANDETHSAQTPCARWTAPSSGASQLKTFQDKSPQRLTTPVRKRPRIIGPPDSQGQATFNPQRRIASRCPVTRSIAAGNRVSAPKSALLQPPTETTDSRSTLTTCNKRAALACCPPARPAYCEATHRAVA
jgi:hypothetical protein